MNNPAYFHRQSVAYLHAIINNNAARVGDEDDDDDYDDDYDDD